VRNSAVIVLVAQGVPMILAGDEFGRTQQGNNNAWCQANEISWLDSELAARNEPLRRFWKLLIDFRRRHPALRRTSFFGPADVDWHGCLLGAPGWNDGSSRVLSFTVHDDEDVHVILNMDDQALDFELPARTGGGWRRAFDTALPSPNDASAPGAEPAVPDARLYRAEPR